MASCESLLNICRLLRGGLSEFVLVLLRRSNGGFVFFRILVHGSACSDGPRLSHCPFLDFKEISFICAVSHLIGWKSPKPVTPSPCFWPLPSHRVGSYSQISTQISTLSPPVQITQNVDLHLLRILRREIRKKKPIVKTYKTEEGKQSTCQKYDFMENCFIAKFFFFPLT